LICAATRVAPSVFIVAAALAAVVEVGFVFAGGCLVVRRERVWAKTPVDNEIKRQIPTMIFFMVFSCSIIDLKSCAIQ
jgi:hypothetical protein